MRAFVCTCVSTRVVLNVSQNLRDSSLMVSVCLSKLRTQSRNLGQIRQ